MELSWLQFPWRDWLPSDPDVKNQLFAVLTLCVGLFGWKITAWLVRGFYRGTRAFSKGVVSLFCPQMSPLGQKILQKIEVGTIQDNELWSGSLLVQNLNQLCSNGAGLSLWIRGVYLNSMMLSRYDQKVLSRRLLQMIQQAQQEQQVLAVNSLINELDTDSGTAKKTT